MEASLARGADTAARALWVILRDHGYARCQNDLGKILRISEKNAYKYLLPEGHKNRISPRIDTIAHWCWAVSQTTGLTLRLVVDSSAEVSLEVSGYNASGEAVEEQVIVTSYREVDLLPLQSWSSEWFKFLKRYKSFYTV
jgi:hypothetical protein